MSFLTKNPQNRLRTIIFTDGTLRSVTRETDDVKMTFVNYCGSLVEISFRGVSRLLLGDVFDGAGIMEASFQWSGDSWMARFTDDDNETILELTYADVDVE